MVSPGSAVSWNRQDQQANHATSAKHVVNCACNHHFTVILMPDLFPT